MPLNLSKAPNGIMLQCFQALIGNFGSLPTWDERLTNVLRFGGGGDDFTVPKLYESTFIFVQLSTIGVLRVRKCVV